MGWKWKSARAVDDVLHLLNGETRYDRPVPDARICMAWRGEHPYFWVFATKAARSRVPHEGLGGWAVRSVRRPEEVVAFLDGEEARSGRVDHLQVCVAWVGDHHEFWIFHRIASGEADPTVVFGGWSWQLCTRAVAALDFLNGTASQAGPVSAARIATAHRDRHDEYFIFYQQNLRGPHGVWSWQAATSPDAVRGTVEVKDAATRDFQIAAPSADLGSFQVFTHPLPRPTPRVVDLTRPAAVDHR
ncbi:MAG: hypothetical protein U0Q19_01090 [Kineosporiaceae bacterium]